ncbi:hypothetical protein GCM10009821_06740 [Aeromicrobium halocynthiae]|uniref:SAF domain-containing protein n=1 Tax=Aeromicrobium halocynthiae TaxID=560557 RepID=A0ABN2VX81_9ACTN
MLGAAVLGARTVAAADDRVTYWAVADDVTAGSSVSTEQLTPTRASLEGRVSDGVLRTDEELPAPVGELRWSQDLPAGTLLSAQHLDRSTDVDTTQLPLSVASGAAPTDLAGGDLVDVWIGPAPGETTADPARLVLESVRVVSEGTGVDGASARTVVVELGEVDLDGEVVASLSTGHVTLVRRS